MREQNHTFKPCGDCSACCEGSLEGISYGNKFGNHKKCFFLVENKCTIYDQRPNICKKFQCAWTQNLFNREDMRPDKCGLVISVENDDSNNQYLSIVETKKTLVYSEYYKEVENFCERNNTYFRIKRPINTN